MRGAGLLAMLMTACSSTTNGPSQAVDAGGGEAETDAVTGVPSDARVDGSPEGSVDAAAPGSLLWFGPHPDDELYLAPLLGQYCVDWGWSCTFVIATRGEGGSCGLAGGCHPDLATVRADEMKASAALFGATLDHWDLGDDGAYQPYPGDVEKVVSDWAAKAGGLDALLARVTETIEAVDPDVVYSMDWRHGCYCHPTHRALGAVVGRAVLDMGAAGPPLKMLAAASKQFATGMGFVPVAPNDPSLEVFDATTYLPSIDGRAWLYLVEVLRTHRSQFDLTPADIDSIANGPDEHKRIYTVSLDAVVRDDPAYAGLCAPSTF